MQKRLTDRRGSRGELPCRAKIKSARVSRLRWLVKHKGNRRRRPKSRRRPESAWESEELLDELENCSHPRSQNGRRYKLVQNAGYATLKLNSHFSYESARPENRTPSTNRPQRCARQIRFCSSLEKYYSKINHSSFIENSEKVSMRHA